MPDTKFTLSALREHLRRYVWIYIFGIAACLVGTSLLWTTTAPRPDIDETVTVFLADVSSNPDPLAPIARHMLEEVQPLDEKLKVVEFQTLSYTADDYTSSILLMTRLTVGEGDAFLASQDAMDALARSEALMDLEDSLAQGWLSEYGLEPYTAEWTDEETGEHYRHLVGLRLDDVDALIEMGAFNNEGAFLCVAVNGGNVETTMKALEVMMKDLTEGDYAHADDPEPAA